MWRSSVAGGPQQVLHGPGEWPDSAGPNAVHGHAVSGRPRLRRGNAGEDTDPLDTLFLVRVAASGALCGFRVTMAADIWPLSRRVASTPLGTRSASREGCRYGAPWPRCRGCRRSVFDDRGRLRCRPRFPRRAVAGYDQESPWRVRAYCRSTQLPYAETSLLGSYRQALRFLHRIGRAARSEPAVPAR